MKLSFQWLCDFADFQLVDENKLLEKISLSICEIDDFSDYMPHLSHVIAVNIVKIEKHPNADKLRICEIFDGRESRTVVTGAPNAEKGDILPLAIPGAMLGEKEIKESELKGIRSYGMFCSEKELGFSEDHSGVMKLQSNAKLGDNLRTIFGLEDKILEIDNKSITHRPDLWSHFGFARELAAQLRVTIKFNPFHSEYNFDSLPSPKVVVNDKAHSYYASRITGAKTLPSVHKIKSRLERCGIRSINNIVDVSNYVLLEMGQPTHFFDSHALGELSIEVDHAKNGESLELLDGSLRELSSSMLIIRNQGKPVAIAGVMGGQETSVTDSSTELVLESAVFKREDIRKSIRSTSIRSEASVRYEKGLNPNSAIPVLKRSLALLKENNAGDFKVSNYSGYNHKENHKTIIELSFDFINKKLGKIFDRGLIVVTLEKLGFRVTINEEELNVIVPEYRQNYDITIPEDLIEEIGRSLEYRQIEILPIQSEVRPQTLNNSRQLERTIKNYLSRNAGYNEVYNYSFASSKDNLFEGKTSSSVEILNSMPEEFKYLRNSVYPSLIKNLVFNSDRFEYIKIFEYSRTNELIDKNSLPDEKKWFAIAVMNTKKSGDSIDILESDFLKARQDIEGIFQYLKLDYSIVKHSTGYFHPNGSVAFISNNTLIAELGILHPRHYDSYGLKKKPILGKIWFDELLNLIESKGQDFKFKAPSQFPQGQLDITLIMDKNADTSFYANLIKNASIPEIDNAWVHDIYIGDNYGHDKKSVTYRIHLLSHNETFTSTRIQAINEEIIKLAKDNNFSLR